MKIKNFNNYIKESFTSSVEAGIVMQKFDKGKLSVHPDDIIDSLEIEDIKSFYSTYQHFINLSNGDGKEISLLTKKTFDSKLFIKQLFYLSVEIQTHSNSVTSVGHLFKQSISEENFDDFLSNLNIVKDKVKKTLNKFENSRNVKIDYKINISNTNRDNKKTIYLHYDVIIIQPIDNEYIKELYENFINSNISKKVDEVMVKLKALYHKHEIEDPILDINQEDFYSDSKVVMVGFFTDDEIYVVATIDKESGNVKINYEEFYRSLQN